jgi:hypothetical protein
MGQKESGSPRGGVTLALAKLPTTPEIRSLIAKLLLPIRRHPAFVWAWSRWRREHQAQAAISHRKQRSYMHPQL